MPIRKKDPPNPERQLMIKTKACQRLVKEVAYYEAEVKENEATLADMKAQNKDPYDIKKFEEVLGESYMMIPDSTERLKRSLEDLLAYTESAEVSEIPTTNEWLSKASELLKAEKARYDSNEDDVKETKLDDLKDGEAF